MPQYQERHGQLVIDEGMNAAGNAIGCIVQGLHRCTIAAGVLMAIVGALNSSTPSPGGYYHASSFHRFNGSYAPGATANALEHLADRSIQNQGATWFLGGVGLVALAFLWGIHSRLDSLLQRLPPTPRPPPL